MFRKFPVTGLRSHADSEFQQGLSSFVFSVVPEHSCCLHELLMLFCQQLEGIVIDSICCMTASDPPPPPVIPV